MHQKITLILPWIRISKMVPYCMFSLITGGHPLVLECSGNASQSIHWSSGFNAWPIDCLLSVLPLQVPVDLCVMMNHSKLPFPTPINGTNNL